MLALLAAAAAAAWLPTVPNSAAPVVPPQQPVLQPPPLAKKKKRDPLAEVRARFPDAIGLSKRSLASAGEHFAAEGFVTNLQLLLPDSETHLRWRREFDAFIHTELGPSPTNTNWQPSAAGQQSWAAERHWNTPLFWEMATHPRMLDLAEVLLGPDVLLFSSFIFCKFGQSSEIAVHQDSVYWGVEPPNAVSIWYAMDEVRATNGPIWLKRGTHKQGPAGSAGLERSPDVPPNEREHVYLQPGEVFANHGLLVHGSEPNTENSRRCGISFRYMPATAKPASQEKITEDQLQQLAKRLDPSHKEGSGEKYLEEKIEHGRAKSEDGVWKALLVRGEDRHRNWGHNHPPFPFSKGVFKRSLPKPDL